MNKGKPPLRRIARRLLDDAEWNLAKAMTAIPAGLPGDETHDDLVYHLVGTT